MDLLQISESLTSLGLFTPQLASLLLFDIYRGNFSEETLPSAKFKSPQHLTAKLKLISLLLS
jgi:hypothetical protein